MFKKILIALGSLIEATLTRKNTSAARSSARFSSVWEDWKKKWEEWKKKFGG